MHDGLRDLKKKALAAREMAINQGKLLSEHEKTGRLRRPRISSQTHNDKNHTPLWTVIALFDVKPSAGSARVIDLHIVRVYHQNIIFDNQTYAAAAVGKPLIEQDLIEQDLVLGLLVVPWKRSFVQRVTFASLG